MVCWMAIVCVCVCVCVCVWGDDVSKTVCGRESSNMVQKSCCGGDVWSGCKGALSNVPNHTTTPENRVLYTPDGLPTLSSSEMSRRRSRCGAAPVANKPECTRDGLLRPFYVMVCPGFLSVSLGAPGVSWNIASMQRSRATIGQFRSFCRVMASCPRWSAAQQLNLRPKYRNRDVQLGPSAQSELGGAASTR
jgi:hypothetical protein